MDGRCATCKWWNPPEGADTPMSGECLGVYRSGISGIVSINIERPGIKTGPGDQYLGRTSHDFGCVHHEPASEEKKQP